MARDQIYITKTNHFKENIVDFS